MNTKLYIGLFASSLLAFAGVAGCSDDTSTGSGGSTGSTSGSDTTTTTTTTTGGSTTSSTGTGGGSMAPPAPMLGAQIDRFGRPAVNTALNHTFDADAMAAGKAKNDYNADVDAAKWAATYGAEVSGNLAILDSLDTTCGNQIAAGATAVAGRYNNLAGVLADDRVWLNTAAAACTTYLAVEANFLGLANMDCGGRKLDYDVIDVTYSALAIGAFMGVGDGIPADAKTKGATFPYLAGPN
jgi:hypothetical protein